MSNNCPMTPYINSEIVVIAMKSVPETGDLVPAPGRQPRSVRIPDHPWTIAARPACQETRIERTSKAYWSK